MVDKARIMAFTLARTRAVRKESYLLHLPHCFSSASKTQLQCSDVDSDLLFDSASVEKAPGYQGQQGESDMPRLCKWAMRQNVSHLYNMVEEEVISLSQEFYQELGGI
ncbi:hypothetical protein E2C01_019391 [Portunus trituberculatus]|uniref:Uncharacterized protein n=1 Tax=Portunus trituberculatus TaxID=210409 RepID=A0A5B7DY50_PORTR|nr:hypothetical protein [Portunus trituberculatus]